jgi:hypothetical protein
MWRILVFVLVLIQNSFLQEHDLEDEDVVQIIKKI